MNYSQVSSIFGCMEDNSQRQQDKCKGCPRSLKPKMRYKFDTKWFQIAKTKLELLLLTDFGRFIARPGDTHILCKMTVSTKSLMEMKPCKTQLARRGQKSLSSYKVCDSQVVQRRRNTKSAIKLLLILPKYYMSFEYLCKVITF